MPINDPFPKKEFLTQAEVMRWMNIPKDEWKDFSETEPGFPKMVRVGKTKSGEPRMRYKKSKVMAYIYLLGG